MGVLVVSGILEAVWATALGKSEGFTRLWPSIVFFVALVLSMGGLALALRDIPTGTGYAVWVGIGATLTVVYPMILSRATLVSVARERVQDGRGVGVGRCGRGELSAGYADGDVAEGSQGADEFTSSSPTSPHPIRRPWRDAATPASPRAPSCVVPPMPAPVCPT